MRSLVVVDGDEDKDNEIEQLLLFNNLPQEEKDLYPYTGHCFIMPFYPTGEITQQMVLGMMENQNYFLENQVSVAVQGFTKFEMLVTDMVIPPADEHNARMEGVDPPKAMLIVWLLKKRAID
eukprot:6264856-Ditylum_brightwellii.AAC.1